MILKSFHRYETGCASYLLGCGTLGACAVVDPLEPYVDEYLAFAADKQMKITHVLETHVHADHRSAGRDLAQRTGARYGLHRSADVAFAFDPLDDGQEIELGNTRLQVLHTPGHTPESVCYVVRDLRRGPTPWFVLTGDTLFVGAVGRPDLPGQTKRNAAQLHASIHDKLLSLPETVEIYPAHFSGSMCGAGMSGKPSSTLAFEKAYNPLLSASREDFIAALLDVAPKPDDMVTLIQANRGHDGR